MLQFTVTEELCHFAQSETEKSTETVYTIPSVVFWVKVDGICVPSLLVYILTN